MISSTLKNLCQFRVFHLFFFFSIFLFSTTSFAQLDIDIRHKVYEYKQFRVGYNLEDELARSFTDLNNNGVPDSVEDTAIQLYAAHKVLVDYYGFRDPLKGEKHFSLAEPTKIDVNLWYFKEDLNQEFDSRNSSASKKHQERQSRAEAIEQRDHSYVGFTTGIPAQSEFDPGVVSLTMNLVAGSRVRDQGTAVHEYFHMIQQTYAYWSIMWLSEGTATWSQDLVQSLRHAYVPEDLESFLDDSKKLSNLRQSAYTAVTKFFFPLIALCNDKDTLPEEFTKQFTYVDGSSVFKDNAFYGANTIRSLYECLEYKETELINQFGDLGRWLYERRISEKNDPYVLECAFEVLAECS